MGFVDSSEGVIPFGESEFAQPRFKFTDDNPSSVTDTSNFDPYEFSSLHPMYEKRTHWRSTFPPLES